MKQVLFVCVANSGRSQMAEAFFNKHAQGQARAESAGTRPRERICPEIIEVMSEVGIDVSHKRPKPLTSEMLERADIMITMGCDVQAACPATLADAVDWDLEDPDRKPMEEMRGIRDEIELKVLQLLEELQSAESPIRE